MSTLDELNKETKVQFIKFLILYFIILKFKFFKKA